MSVQQFALPDLGEGLTESELVTWMVEVGDTVELNQILAEVETAKALVELPSPFAGTVSGLLVEEGTTVQVGTPIVAIETADAAAPAATDETPSIPDAPEPPSAPSEPGPPEAPPAPPPAPERTSVLVGYGPAVASDARPRRRERREAWLAEHSVAEHSVAEHSGAAEAGAEPRHPEPVSGADVRVPVSGVQRRMAEAMVQSAFTAPHASVRLEVDVSETLAQVERLRAHRRLQGARVGLLTLVGAACLTALRHAPALNSRWDAERREIIEFGHVGLGIAVAAERGLLVPHIAAADALSFAELARAMEELIGAARAGTATPAQLSGGTFTITNVGVFGVDGGTPILPPGQAGILAVGAIRERPWVHGGEVVPRPIVELSLSFDHRLVDGRQASEFLTTVGELLSDPGSAMAYR